MLKDRISAHNKRHRGIGAVAALVTAVAIAVAGCTTTLDSRDLEAQIKKQVEAQVPDGGSITISCPDSIKPESGKEFRCTLEADDGSQTGVAVTLTDDKGGFKAEVLPVEE